MDVMHHWLEGFNFIRELKSRPPHGVQKNLIVIHVEANESRHSSERYRLVGMPQAEPRPGSTSLTEGGAW